MLEPGLRHFFYVLFQGDIKNKMRREWQRYKQNRRKKKIQAWESQAAARTSFVAPIQPGVKMNFFLNNRLCFKIYHERFEWNERQFVNRILRRGDVFIDVGANMGLYTLIAAKCVESSGQVHAFEPCSLAYSRLLESISLNGFTNVSCHQLALSNEAAVMTMKVVSGGFDAWNSLGTPCVGAAFEQESIRAITLDSFVEEKKLRRITMIKIDVEGWETYVLKGAVNILTRPDAPILLVEFNPRASLAAGSSCEDLYRMLKDFGYETFIYNDKTRALERSPLRQEASYNLIACKRPQEILAKLHE